MADIATMTAHTCTVHATGSRACYQRHGCRCDDCLTASHRYAKRNKLAHASGRPPLVPAAPILAHMDALHSCGMSRLDIARAAGLPYGTVENLAHRPGTTVTRRVAAALLTVRGTTHGAGYVDAVGTRRRLQALRRLGWTYAELARRAGISGKSMVRGWAYADTVSAETRRHIAGLYDDLWDKQPPPGRGTTRARLDAEKRGYLPPLMWDDDSIDDPSAQPHATSPGPFARRDAHIEDARELLAQGEHSHMIAARLGIRPDTLYQLIKRHAPGLLDDLQHRKSS